MAQYKLKVGKVGQVVIDTYKGIENSVVGSYKKIETTFADKFLEKVEDDENTNTKNN